MEIEDSILQYFIDNEIKEVRYSTLRVEMVRLYDIEGFFKALTNLYKKNILYPSHTTVYINSIEAFVKRVLKLRYKLSATILCLFIFAYKKDIIKGEDVIVEVDEVIKTYSYTGLCLELLHADRRTRWNSIHELKERGLLEPMRYKMYKFNYKNLSIGLVKVIILSTSTYSKEELQSISF
jgi:hypothetical protein